MTSILSTTSLTKKYGKVEALKGISLEIPKGQIIGLLGPNGSGKTTLIKLACGLLTPTSGSITIDSNPIGIQTKLDTAYLPDQDYLNDWMKVKDIVSMFADFYSNFNKDKAYEMMTRLSIDPSIRLKTLSKGNKEKVQLILTMARDAKLYLLDEPIGGVDPAARDYILQTIISSYNPESTILISTHLIAEVEEVLNSFIFIKNGEIIKQSTVEEVRNSESKTVDALFREMFKC